MSLVPSVYSSTDPGAPALTGQVGSLVALLDAVLVNGYGAGPTAKPGAGWTIEYTATNKRVYRNNPLSSTGGRVRVDDTSGVSGSNARTALVRAYESMSDVDTGTGPAPTVAQKANGAAIYKSNTLDATARTWIAFAGERFIYLFINTGVTGAGFTGVGLIPTFIGDFVSRKPGDAYNFMVQAQPNHNFSGSENISNGFFNASYNIGDPQTNSNQAWILRGESGALGGVPTGMARPSCYYDIFSTAFGVPYPDPLSGGMLYERVLVRAVGVGLRGYMPNLYLPLHRVPFTDLAVLDDVEGLPAGTDLVAKTIHHQTYSTGATYTSQLLFDLTNAW